MESRRFRRNNFHPSNYARGHIRRWKIRSRISKWREKNRPSQLTALCSSPVSRNWKCFYRRIIKTRARNGAWKCAEKASRFRVFTSRATARKIIRFINARTFRTCWKLVPNGALSAGGGGIYLRFEAYYSWGINDILPNFKRILRCKNCAKCGEISIRELKIVNLSIV